MPLDAPIERAERWDVLIQQGSTFKRSLEFEGLDLSLFSLRGQIRRAHAAPTALAEYEFELEGTNVLHISLPDSVTEALPEGRLVHDVEIYVDEPGHQFVARVLEGNVTVTPEVTR